MYGLSRSLLFAQGSCHYSFQYLYDIISCFNVSFSNKSTDCINAVKLSYGSVHSLLLLDMTARVSDALFYGRVEVQHFGIWGSVCDVDWDDRDATVLCRQLGYRSGNASKGGASSDMPTVLGSVHCNGTESKLSDCLMSSFSDDHQCTGRKTRAAVVCSKEAGTGQLHHVHYIFTTTCVCNSLSKVINGRIIPIVINSMIVRGV